MESRNCCVAVYVLLVMLLCVGVAQGQGQVWVVDDDAGPGVDFTQLQSAIDAASAGDTLLLRDGSYDSFLMAGKALSLVGDSGASVSCSGGLIDSVLAGSVLVQGINMGLGSAGLTVRETTAPVWIEACSFIASSDAVKVRECTSVVLVGCNLEGLFGASGLAVENAPGQQVFVYDSEMMGGRGNPSFEPGPIDGGSGVTLDGGRLVLSACSLFGGSGGDYFQPSCGGPPGPSFGGGDGGSGLFVQSGDAYSRDNFFFGGLGGSFVPAIGCIIGSDGSPGSGVSVTSSGTYTPWSVGTFSLNVTSPLREGQQAALTLLGPPLSLSAPVYLFVSTSQEHTFYPSLSGGLFLPLSNVVISYHGRLPASGALSMNFIVPDLPVGTDAQGVYVQMGIDAPGDPLMSAPAFVLFLDGSL